VSILLAACIAIGFHDGDTATVQCEGRAKKMVVRVAEIDAPEFQAFSWGDQPGRIAARDEAVKLCYKKPLKVRLNKFDNRTRRWIAHLECDGVDLSRHLVGQGLAWAYIPDKKSDIPALQKAAQDQRIGLWAGTPVAPNIWRRDRMHQRPYVNEP
jgi:endonuclease YncB( thermonuclease family)